MNPYQFRIALLSPRKRELLARRLRDQSGPATANDQELVAYVVCKPSTEREPDPSELRRYLKEKLPVYMIPQSFVSVRSLPRTPNGKVDIKALKEQQPAGDDITPSFVAPRTSIEQTLAQVWAEVLGFDRIGIHDNFFEIGGDSIQSIQIVARARKAGLNLSPNDLFEHQTIAELRMVVEEKTAGKQLVDDSRAQAVIRQYCGPVALTPIQRWFFEQDLQDPHHWNQSLWLEAASEVDIEALESAVRKVIAHHDAFRLRFRRESDEWRQYAVDSDPGESFRCIDLTDLGENAEQHMLDELAAKLENSLELEQGPLHRIALFRLEGRSARLFITIHHLIVDPYSWTILLDDLESAYHRAVNAEAERLPDQSASYKQWADALQKYARSDRLDRDLAYWTAQADAPKSRLPTDANGLFTERSARTITVSLSADETEVLSTDLPRAYNTQTEDILLTALAQALASRMPQSELWLGIERHGREAVDRALDLSRTVGWFTAYFPARLDLTMGPEPDAALKSVKEQMRRIPAAGLAYGVACYLIEDANTKLRDLPSPDVVFNYGGRAHAPSDRGLFRPLGVLAPSRSPANTRPYVLEINAFIADDSLQVNFTFSENIFDEKSVADICLDFERELHRLVEHGRSTEGAYTPSDFPDVELSQEELDRLLDRL